MASVRTVSSVVSASCSRPICFVLLCSACLQVMLVEAQNSVRVNMGGYQSTRGPKRRKLNAVDVELDDRDIDLFLAQIVAILKSCWMSMS